jgi:hypothetical protein
MNIQSEAGLMNKHEEILSKYENEHELTWSGQKLYPKAVILKAMRELEESLAARTEGDIASDAWDAGSASAYDCVKPEGACGFDRDKHAEAKTDYLNSIK